MKKIAILSSSILLSFTVATSSFAYDRDFGEKSNRDRHQPAVQHNKDYRGGPQNRGGPQYSSDRRGGDFKYQNQGRPQHVQAQHFKRGERLPDRYLKNDRYYVKNWRAHDLRQPPRGYRWVDVDGRYLLVSVVTGVIATILLGS
ncbi:RcnB family protein [Acinetobacter puyangensis]|uniref:Regulator RcnB of Ni and Co efflux n=1 Tax=Acinetobacter puyangensis TaxID=1096779 RepID=A0A240E693_9GAMM|nr:RcnB family protein [Acinetobacter puyangensis]SNX43395.1 regulator RcnB of Ni and Co efflux [Acinetobacter puyangensis]